MTDSQIEIHLIAVVTAAACALPGVFLVLRRMAMMSDAISHSILLGIVLAFFVVENLSSPLLVVGAALTGVATVSLVELLHSAEDAHGSLLLGHARLPQRQAQAGRGAAVPHARLRGPQAARDAGRRPDTA